jgi:two-component system response regulator NreC
LKEAADAEVVDAVREVANGGRYVHPALGARLIAAEIAKMLFLSVRTVETHRAHIMQKLRLSTRAELVRYAIDHGLLEEPRE